MDLLCKESISSVNEVLLPNQASAVSNQQQMEMRLNTAIKDPIFLDNRCLENLLKAEDRHEALKNTNYFSTVQKEISPSMRRVVAEWVIDVSAKYPKIRPFARKIAVGHHFEQPKPRKLVLVKNENVKAKRDDDDDDVALGRGLKKKESTKLSDWSFRGEQQNRSAGWLVRRSALEGMIF